MILHFEFEIMTKKLWQINVEVKFSMPYSFFTPSPQKKKKKHSRIPFLVGKQGNMIRFVILFFPRNKSLFLRASNLKNCLNVFFKNPFLSWKEKKKTKDQTFNPLVEKGNFNH